MPRKRNEGICSIEGCSKPNSVKGLCRNHYASMKAREFRRKHPGYDPRNISDEKCSVEGCLHPVRTKGLCNNHYARMWRNGTTDKLYKGNKRSHYLYSCWFERKQRGVLCEEWQDFWTFLAGVGERPGRNFSLIRLREEPYGPTNFEWREHLKRRPGESKKDWYARKWSSRREKFPEYEDDRWMRRKYGMTLEQYRKMDDAQKHKCAICGSEEQSFSYHNGRKKNLSIDHCHRTGKVRALLCFRCNGVIGKMEESIDLLTKAVNYLNKHKEAT